MVKRSGEKEKRSDSTSKPFKSTLEPPRKIKSTSGGGFYFSLVPPISPTKSVIHSSLVRLHTSTAAMIHPTDWSASLDARFCNKKFPKRREALLRRTSDRSAEFSRFLVFTQRMILFNEELFLGADEDVAIAISFAFQSRQPVVILFRLWSVWLIVALIVSFVLFFFCNTSNTRLDSIGANWG